MVVHSCHLGTLEIRQKNQLKLKVSLGYKNEFKKRLSYIQYYIQEIGHFKCTTQCMWQNRLMLKAAKSKAEISTHYLTETCSVFLCQEQLKSHSL